MLDPDPYPQHLLKGYRMGVCLVDTGTSTYGTLDPQPLGALVGSVGFAAHPADVLVTCFNLYPAALNAPVALLGPNTMAAWGK